MRRGARWHEQHFNERWLDLSRYNSEVYRGVLHTPEFAALMAAKQAYYQQIAAQGGDALWTCEPFAAALSLPEEGDT